MKFGGTSLKDANLINKVKDIYLQSSKKTVLVVSAPAGVTDSLQKIVDSLRHSEVKDAIKELELIKIRFSSLAAELKIVEITNEFINNVFSELEGLIKAIDIIGEITDKSYAYILSRGEVLSSYLIENYFRSNGINSVLANSTDFIKTSGSYIEAEVDFEKSAQRIDTVVLDSLKEKDLVICGGFIASNSNREVTILGRGGSDYTAAIIASCINSESLEIWTDVNGILTADPKKVKNAKLVRNLSYREAAELAYFGAKVLHPKTILPAVDKGIPVYVKNTYSPASKGTKIIAGNPFEYKSIKAIAYRSDITVINIESNRMLGTFGFLSKVFDIFKKNETSVDLVTTSEVSISLTIDKEDKIKEISSELETFSKVEIFRNKAIISAIGESIRNTVGIGSKFFGAMSGINISMISLGASEVNLSIIIDEVELDTALENLHNEFFGNGLDPKIFEELTD